MNSLVQTLQAQLITSCVKIRYASSVGELREIAQDFIVSLKGTGVVPKMEITFLFFKEK
jgi:hypothetical protein